jgi:ABC-type glycerol-3-phosphate transport system permease component
MMATVKGQSICLFGRHLFFLNLPGILLILFLSLLLLFMALPLVYLVSTAFKPMSELYLFPPRFLVSRPTFGNFFDLFSSFDSRSVPFSRNVFNSLFVSVMTVILTVLACTMAAYGLVKHNPRGGSLIFNLILVALMFSTHVTQIPNYMVVRFLGFLDTYAALVVPKIAVAYNMFLVKQFLQQMPDAFLEAGRLDGANEWQLYSKIVMPYLKPAWATLVVFSFVSTWNDYFSPVVFLINPALKTLPLAVQNIAGGPGAAALSTAGAMAAAALLTVVPSIVVFTAMQKRVLSTMAHSGIKA